MDMTIDIEYIEDDYALVVLLSNPQRRRLKGIADDATRELSRAGWKTEDGPPEMKGLKAEYDRAYSALSQIQGDVDWRNNRANLVKKVTFTLFQPTNKLRDEVRKRVNGWSGEAVLEDEKAEVPEEERWARAPEFCVEVLKPVVKSGWKGDLRLEIEDSLADICFDLLFPRLSERLRFFTTDSSSVSKQESPALET